MRLAMDLPARARLGQLGRWVAIVLACYLGGVAATNLSPTVVETANYRAVLRLDPLPRHTPVLHSPTIIGDVDVAFTSPVVAPGLDIAVSVREGITSVLTGPAVSIRDLQPSDAEISQAVRDAAIGLAWRFALGGLIVAASLSLAVHYARRLRRPERQHLIAVASAVVVTMVGTGVSTALTYQRDRFAEYTTTGVLGTVQRNAGMLQGVEARATQATPYLRNLLAVSQALQEKFVPANLAEQPVAARLLLVSDIHGANQYALMRTIVQDEDIDAVIDSGDLINFGHVAEADAAGIFGGIQSLGVPYIFTAGNHDQSSATDRALLARMARVPNVVLLQKGSGAYQELSFHGLRITGFNDPRYFGDDNKDPTGKQRPAVEAYNEAMADEPESDLVVTHEPFAATDVDKGRIVVNGHMHSATLDGNRIQVGTFTGGGVVSHYNAGEGEELTGQPYAFDIITFGQHCSLTQLTRYSFRNLLEGRPAYDNVQVVNGAIIDPAGAAAAAEADKVTQPGEPAAGGAERRSCSRLEETATRTITNQTPAPTSTASAGAGASTP